MVGVPGNSKGCVTCKRRRIKCDESKPTCKRCEKSGYVCGGYKTNIKFINTSSTTPFKVDSTNQPSSTIEYAGNVPVTVVPRMRTAPLPTELGLVAFRPQICMSFLMQNFLWRAHGDGWFELAAKEQLDSLSSRAIKALSNIVYGMSHHQEETRLLAYLQHGKVLRGLNSGLADPRKIGLENLLVPILISLMYASYEGNSAAASSHFKGLIKFLQVCGPQKFQKDSLKRAFESARSSLVTSFILVRQPCFLAEDDWKTIPWALDPASKSQQNILTDILVDVPALLAAYDAQYQEPGEKQQWNNDYDLLTRVGTSLFSLYCWRYAWELLNPNAAYETAPPPTIANTRLEPNYLHFHKYEDGANIQLYNAILLFLLNLLDRLSPSTATIATILQTTAIHAAEVSSYDIGTSSTNTSPLLLPHTVLDSVKPAIEIIRAFEYQILNRTENMSSNLFFLFPLGIAGEALQDQKEYWAWIRILLDTSSATTPYAAGRNKWFGNYDEAKLKARRDNIRKEKEMSTVGDAGQETGQDFQYRRAVFLAGVSSTS